MKTLLIDDSVLFQGILLDIFSGAEMATTSCSNAKSALIKAKTDQYDFICIAYILPDTDGISLCIQIRQLAEYKSIPIILFTSEDESQVYTNALRAGITAVFKKNDLEQLENFTTRLYNQQKNLSGKVLYIEDDSSQRQFITAILKSKGLDVDAFSNAEQALAQFMVAEYQLVITDIILEGRMTGMELTNRIRRLSTSKGDIPILAVTGFDDLARRIELFCLGVSDYVIKPIIEEELISRVRNLLHTQKFYAESIAHKEKAESEGKAKSEFIAYMSHELKTPLNAILGFSQLMLDSDSQPALGEQVKQLNTIHTSGKHLLEIINDSLDLTQVERGEITLNYSIEQLSILIEKAVNQVSSLALNSDISIHIHPIPPEIVIRIDERRLLQIIINLLSNAIKYNCEQGSIQILCKNISESCVRILIKDTGTGMTHKQQTQVFEPFHRLQQTKNVEGNGLGLAVCQQLAKAMGFSIALKSTQGTGSTFWFDLNTEMSS